MSNEPTDPNRDPRGPKQMRWARAVMVVVAAVFAAYFLQRMIAGIQSGTMPGL